MIIVVAFGATVTLGEIKINDNLSTTGFLDMSANGVTPDGGDATLNVSFDQFELDFIYNFGNVSARADINALPSTSAAPGTNVFLEQAYINYVAGKTNLYAGRFLSSSGFEAAEPIGLFQYSTSKTLVYGYYQNGMAASYTGALFGVYGAVVSDLWNPQEFDAKTPGFEGQVSLTPTKELTAKATFLYQMYDDTTSHDNQQLLNAWAQYAGGPVLVAAEFNMLTNWGADNLAGMGWLGMINYKITSKFALTARYSALMLDDNRLSTDDMDGEVTLSPGFTINGNWLVLAEAKREIDKKVTSYAVESIFTF